MSGRNTIQLGRERVLYEEAGVVWKAKWTPAGLSLVRRTHFDSGPARIVDLPPEAIPGLADMLVGAVGERTGRCGKQLTVDGAHWADCVTPEAAQLTQLALEVGFAQLRTRDPRTLPVVESGPDIHEALLAGSGASNKTEGGR